MEDSKADNKKDGPAWREQDSLLGKISDVDVLPGTPFDPTSAYALIARDWQNWDNAVKPKVYVVGISGGVDSSTVAALACKIFGKDRVVGVSMPCDGQKDMWAVDLLFKTLGIKRIDIDIGDMFANLKQKLENNCLETTDDMKTNAPARLRMTTLFAVGQSVGGVVVNTCNYSESCQGYDTLFGDDCGSYAPIQDLVKTEVKALAAWLGLPDELANKTPIDGLQPLTDEEKLGITYADLDAFIRGTRDVGIALEAQILQRYARNKFKMDIVRLPGPKFNHMRNRIREIMEQKI